MSSRARQQCTTQQCTTQQCTTMVFALMAAILALSVGVMQPALGDVDSETPPEQRLINIDVKDGAIDSVLRMLAKAAGVNIVIGENVTGRVEAVSLRDVTVETALELITMTRGYYYHRQGNVYVVTVEPVAGTSSVPPRGADSRPLVRPGESAPGPIGPAPVTPPSTAGPAVVTPSPLLHPPQPSSVVAPGDPGEPKTVFKLIHMKFADARQLAAAFGGTESGTQEMGSTRPMRPSEYRRWQDRGNDSYVGPDIFSGGSSASRWGQDDLGGGRGSSGRSTRGSSSSSSGRSSGSSGGLDSMLPGEMDPPTAFLPLNALLVRGTQEEIDQFTEIIAMLDVRTRQVEIACKFVDVQTTAQNALGIDWSIANGALEFWNLGFAPAEAINSVIRYSRGRFQGMLAALEQDGRATVVNEPHVTCPNNSYAEVNFYTVIPYFVATTEYNQFGQRISSEVDVEEVDVENSLYVMPRINADDSITVFLEPELEDAVGEVIGPNGETIPIITTQFVSTQVTVPDGDTIVMGGLIRKDVSFSYKRTPLLHRLPIIGKLFQSKHARTSNSELLIFVTPKIVRDVPAQ